MPTVGIRELKTHASEIVRLVRERRTSYTITYRGQPVAVLAPLEPTTPDGSLPADEGSSVAWDELTRLGEEIGKGWKSPLTSTEMLSQMRR